MEMMDLLYTALTDLTDEDWQDVKEMVQNMLSNRINDFPSDVFQQLFDEKDMKMIFVREMMKKIDGEK